jgi:branched-chain amino acid transport system substrate-binding protein
MLAVEEINAKGGVDVAGVKRPFKIVVSDTRGGEPGVPVHDGLLACEKLVLQEKPHAIVVAPYRSELMMAAMDLFAKHKMITLSTIAQSHKLAAKYKENPEKYKYIFFPNSNAIDNAGYAGRILTYAKKEFGFDRIYFIVQDVLWCRGFSGLTKKTCEKAGYKVLGFDLFPLGATDFSSSLIKAKKAKAQVIFANFDMPQSPILVRQYRDMKIPALLCSYMTPTNVPAAWEALGEKLAYVIGNEMPAGTMTPVKAIPKSMHFATAFPKRWGRCVGTAWTPAYGYNSVYILADAIERAGSLEADKLIPALEKTDIEGAGGRIRFKDHKQFFNEDPKESSILLHFQWMPGGKRVPIYPPVVAEGKIVLPPWMK